MNYRYLNLFSHMRYISFNKRLEVAQKQLIKEFSNATKSITDALFYRVFPHIC